MPIKKFFQDLRRKLSKDAPTSASLPQRLEVAAAYRQRGRVAEALHVYGEVASKYLEQGDAERALAVCRSALELAPDNEEFRTLADKLEPRPSQEATVAPPLVPSIPAVPKSLDNRLDNGSPSGSPSYDIGKASGKQRDRRFLTPTPLPAPLALHEAIDESSIHQPVRIRTASIGTVPDISLPPELDLADDELLAIPDPVDMPADYEPDVSIDMPGDVSDEDKAASQPWLAERDSVMDETVEEPGNSAAGTKAMIDGTIIDAPLLGALAPEAAQAVPVAIDPANDASSGFLPVLNNNPDPNPDPNSDPNPDPNSNNDLDNAAAAVVEGAASGVRTLGDNAVDPHISPVDLIHDDDSDGVTAPFDLQATVDPAIVRRAANAMANDDDYPHSDDDDDGDEPTQVREIAVAGPATTIDGFVGINTVMARAPVPASQAIVDEFVELSRSSGTGYEEIQLVDESLVTTTFEDLGQPYPERSQVLQADTDERVTPPQAAAASSARPSRAASRFDSETVPSAHDVLRDVLVQLDAVSVPDDTVYRLAACAKRQRFARGEHIFRVGDPSNACFIIAQGQVRLWRSDPCDINGQLQEVAQLDKGMFGELALLFEEGNSTPRPRRGAAQALDDCLLYTIPQRLLSDILAANASLHTVIDNLYRERLLAMLLSSELFVKALSARQRKQVRSQFQRVRLAAGTGILRQGTSTGGLYLLLSGSVDIAAHRGSAGVQTLATLREGGFFCDLSFIDNESLGVSVTAAGPVEMEVLSPDVFLDVVIENPLMWQNLHQNGNPPALDRSWIVTGEMPVV